MKLKRTQKPGIRRIKNLGNGEFQIWHSQSLKLSRNWNSIENSYSVSTICRRGQLKRVFDQAERIVEKRMTQKAKEHDEVLRGLAGETTKKGN